MCLSHKSKYEASTLCIPHHTVDILILTLSARPICAPASRWVPLRLSTCVAQGFVSCPQAWPSSPLAVQLPQGESQPTAGRLPALHFGCTFSPVCRWNSNYFFRVCVVFPGRGADLGMSPAGHCRQVKAPVMSTSYHWDLRMLPFLAKGSAWVARVEDLDTGTALDICLGRLMTSP